MPNRLTMLIKENTMIAQDYFYIESGVLKCFTYFTYNEDNEEVKKEVIFCLLSAGDAILPCSALPYSTPAPFNIQVVENAVIHTISADNVKILQKKEPKFDELIQSNLQRIFKCITEIMKINVCSNLQLRYEKLLELYPFLLGISDKNVAAILGVDRVTVTRRRIEFNTNPKKPKNKK